MTDYRSDLSQGRFLNRSQEALDECEYYIEMKGGALEHSQSQHGDDPTGAGENHGDRVIADALCSMLINKTKTVPQKTEKKIIREGTYGFRMRENQRAMAAAAERDGW